VDKKTKYGHTKSVDGERKSVIAHVSTNAWDRTTEKFAKGAWNLQNFLKNPVCLWGHDQSQPPIGKCVSIVEDEMGLLTETVFDQDSEWAMKIFNLFQKGYLNAFSVGFIPKAYRLVPLGEGSEEKGIEFTNAELLEYSAVSIPANPGALVTRGLADVVMKTLGDQALVPTTFEGDDMFIVPVGTKRFPDKKALVEGGPGDIESSVRYVIDLARAAKGKGLPDQQIALLKNAVAVIQELIPAAADPIPPESLQTLSEAVQQLGKAAAGLNQTPRNENLLGKMARQLEDALKAVRPN
jgi:HK97 family phage prohead protease